MDRLSKADFETQRKAVDPRGRWVKERFTDLEMRAVELLDHLAKYEVTRTRDVIQVDTSDYRGLTLLVTREHLEVRLPLQVFRLGDYPPIDRSRFWRRRRWSGLRASDISDLLESGATATLRRKPL